MHDLSLIIGIFPSPAGTSATNHREIFAHYYQEAYGGLHNTIVALVTIIIL